MSDEVPFESLSSWLEIAERSSAPDAAFAVLDAQQSVATDNRVLGHISHLLINERHNPALLSTMAQRLGWNRVTTQYLQALSPRQSTARRGEFAEAITNVLLEEHLALVIPVRKLRFKITSDQSLPSTDTLALRCDSEYRRLEITFVETKLRTTLRAETVTAAHDQLSRDVSEEFPTILGFVLTVLHDRNDPLYEPFLDYLRDRADRRNSEHHIVSIVCDANAWHERVLEHLAKAGDVLANLKVAIIRLGDLANLTNAAFHTIGVTQIEDDE